MEKLKGKSQFNNANQRASKAADEAEQARKFKKEMDKSEFLLNQWNNLMMGVPILLVTSIFLASCFTEFAITYEMYETILDDSHFKDYEIAIWIVGLVVIGFGVVVSHFLGKFFFPELIKVSVFNLMYLQNGNEMLEIEAEEEIRKKIHKEKQIGWGLFVVLMLVVVSVSSIRYHATIGAKGLENEALNLLSMFNIALPSIVILVEVFTGSFVSYLFQYYRMSFKKSEAKKMFEQHKKNCAVETQMAFAILQNAKNTGETFELTKNLMDVLYRVNFLSEATDKYIEEIDIQQCKVIVTDENDFLSQVRIVGLTDTSKLTNASYTDAKGVARLHWNSKEPLHAIQLGSEIFEGPFQANTTHKFEIKNKSELN